MSETSTKQRLVSGVLWMTVVRLLSQSITWIITIFVVRMLTPEDYGLMGMAMLVSAFLALFSEVGLGIAIIQRPGLRADQLSNLGWVIIGLNIFFFVALALSAPAIAAYFKEPELTLLVQVLSTMFVLQGIGAPSSYLLQRRMAFREKAVAELLGNVAGAVATLIGALNGIGVWSLVVGCLVQWSITNALYCVSAPFPLRLSFSAQGFREYFEFGGQVALSRILWYISANADAVVVGRVLGSVQLGFYSLAFQLSSAPLDRLVTIVSQVALPSFSSMQSDESRLQRYYLKLTSTIALVTFPILVGVALVADAAVPLLLTTKWLPLVVPLQILCVVSCFRAVEMLCHPLVIARAQPHISVWNSLLQAIVLPIAFILGAHYGGLQGVALGWLITRPFIFAFLTTLTLRTIQLPYSSYLGALKHPVAGCLLMILAVAAVRRLLIPAAPAVELALSGGTGAVAYVGYQYLFNQETVRETLEVVRAQRMSPGTAVRSSSEAPATS